MANARLSDDTLRSRLQEVIASIRYWLPSIADAARFEESEGTGYWKLAVNPRVAGACPFELLLRAEGKLDLVIGGEVYEDLDLIPFTDFLPLVQAISEGRVVRRHWASLATGAEREVTTIVTFADGRIWQRGRSAKPVSEAVLAETCQSHDRAFLPYRR